jgi:hypothetical protein
MPYDKRMLINYRIQRARETVQEAEMALRHSRFNLAENRIYYAIFYMCRRLRLNMISQHPNMPSFWDGSTKHLCGQDRLNRV